MVLRPPCVSGVSWKLLSDQEPAPQGGRTCSLHPPSARSYSGSAPSSPRPPSPPSSTIATGWCLSHRHRYVTELIQSAGAVHRGHHSRYHRFFSNAAWSIDDLFEALAREAVATFCPEGTIEVGVDDTLCRKRGLTIFGTGMHHDPLISSRKRVHVSWGHDWVILSLLVAQPALVADQGLGPAGGHAAVPQPPGADQGQEGSGQGQDQAGEEAAARSRTTAPAPNWPWS